MNPASFKVARRYAKALVSLCDERGDGVQARQDLDALVAVMAQNAVAAALLANPTVAIAQRKGLLGQMLDALKVQDTARNLASLLLDKGRIASLEAVSREFNALLDQRSGRTEAQVTSAVALDDAAKARLQQSLGQLLGKQVQLTAAVDPQLIGGLVVRVGNTVYDASVANHLARLRQQLVTESVVV
jgi:F-type H+-transporting ATPase subunit delta